MATFNFENLVSNLPDAFAKNPESNNYKLLLIEKRIYDGINCMFQSIQNILNIDNAQGEVLDMYGQRLQLSRGTSDDTQYLIRLKAKIAQSLSDGSRDSVAAALAYVLSTDTSKIRIKSDPETGSVELLDMPMKVLLDAYFTPEQITEMIDDMLPEGVSLSNASFTGTFEFDDPDVYDDNKGFADLEGTVGGYFGLFIDKEV